MDKHPYDIKVASFGGFTVATIYEESPTHAVAKYLRNEGFRAGVETRGGKHTLVAEREAPKCYAVRASR